MSQAPREQWASRLGFLLAAVGSAVGLGNMWRFSYLTAENGGAAFLLLYVLMTAAVGLPVLLAEFAIGRGAGKSPAAALEHFGGRVWRPLGLLFVASGFLILAYYSVIAGWTLRYAAEGTLWGFSEDAGAHFSHVTAGGAPLVWHLFFMAITIGVVSGGVKGGIERTSIVLMPLLFLIVVGLAVYAATLDGAETGYVYYLKVDVNEILSLSVLADAAGQAFFSLSLGMGAMLTYASYLSRDENLPAEALFVVTADFAVAFVAGLVVFPLLFALGLQQEVGGSTVGALFITLPHAFAEMGPAGRIVGVSFFVALVVGALTSAISLLEVVVATAMDSWGWSRANAALVLGSAIALLGVPAALSLDVLGLMDQIAGNVFLLAGGLGLAVYVGWVMPNPIAEVRAGTGAAGWLGPWRTLMRWVAPVVLLAILVLVTVPDTVAAVRTALGG
jgi:NSS family neurotransmitter:Na+ symporter